MCAKDMKIHSIICEIEHFFHETRHLCKLCVRYSDLARITGCVPSLLRIWVGDSPCNYSVALPGNMYYSSLLFLLCGS